MQTRLVLAFALMVPSFLGACGAAGSNHLIVGTWALDVGETLLLMGDEISDEDREEARNTLRSMQIRFIYNADGTAVGQRGMGEETMANRGTYELMGEGENLSVVITDMDSETTPAPSNRMGVRFHGRDTLHLSENGMTFVLGRE